MPDAAIIGAGPAGSAAAVLLAGRGWTVTLVEQHRFPRDKVCGECLSAVGVDTLSRLALLPVIESAGAVWLSRAILHAADGSSATMPLPRAMLGISRHALDSLLLDAAVAAGANVRQPARCEAIEPTANAVFVKVRDLANNRVESITASFVILADGKSAIPLATPARTQDIGIKAHWENADATRDAIELFSLRGCYGGLAAIEAGRWNTALSVPASRVKTHCGNIDSLFHELLTENASLRRRLSGATRVGPWLAAPLPRFAVRRDFPTRVIPVGNAAAALEPIGGEGMGLALRSAELACASLVVNHGHWSDGHSHELLNDYDHLWRARRLGCRAAAMVVSSSKAMNVAVNLLGATDHLARGVFGLMGKHAAHP
ncbi:MAG TPA: FAD-dependent oxidoreductase [Tepidisphaeraceae bacterium]|nr:FAD-dependent oxidoreductase [Tepidisphaeraceae bacterium]